MLTASHMTSRRMRRSRGVTHHHSTNSFHYLTLFPVLFYFSTPLSRLHASPHPFPAPSAFLSFLHPFLYCPVSFLRLYSCFRFIPPFTSSLLSLFCASFPFFFISPLYPPFSSFSTRPLFALSFTFFTNFSPTLISFPNLLGREMIISQQCHHITRKLRHI